MRNTSIWHNVGLRRFALRRSERVARLKRLSLSSGQGLAEMMRLMHSVDTTCILLQVFYRECSYRCESAFTEDRRRAFGQDGAAGDSTSAFPDLSTAARSGAIRVGTWFCSCCRQRWARPSTSWP